MNHGCGARARHDRQVQRSKALDIWCIWVRARAQKKPSGLEKVVIVVLNEAGGEQRISQSYFGSHNYPIKAKKNQAHLRSNAGDGMKSRPPTDPIACVHRNSLRHHLRGNGNNSFPVTRTRKWAHGSMECCLPPFVDRRLALVEKKKTGIVDVNISTWVARFVRKEKVKWPIAPRDRALR